MLLRFITKESVFERHVLIPGIEARCLRELVPGGFRLAGFEQRVRQILADRGPAGRKLDRLLKRGDGLIVMPGAQSFIGFLERNVGRVRRLAKGNGGRGQK